jgi:hypothetical protein
MAIPLLLACGGGHDLTGKLALTDPSAKWGVGNACEGTGGYADIKVGAEVTIKDEAGKILATSTLSKSEAATTQECDFTFTANVEDAKFYQVEVSHRGAVTYSRDDVARQGWRIGMEIGH